MFNIFLLWSGALFRLCRSRRDLVVENFVLRQQLAVLQRRHPRPNLNLCDKLFWVTVRDLATFESPNQLSQGMVYVLVNGVPVIDQEKSPAHCQVRCCAGRATCRSQL